jgi:hypothetical protein
VRARIRVGGHGLDSTGLTGLDWIMSVEVMVWARIRARLCFCEAAILLWVWMWIRLDTFVPHCPIVVCRGCVLSSLLLPSLLIVVVVVIAVFCMRGLIFVMVVGIKSLSISSKP